MAEHEVRFLRPGDEHDIARLQRHLWGTGPAVNARYLAWKYADNPYLDEPPVIVAESGGRIVAMRGTFGVAWEVPGRDRPVVVPCAADLVIDPDHRAQGLYDELSRMTFGELEARGHTHVLNFTANPENYLAATLTQGWKPAGSFEILTRRSAIADRAATLQPGIFESGRLYPLARTGLALGRRLRASVGIDTYRHLARHARRSGGGSPVTISDRPPVDEILHGFAALEPLDAGAPASELGPPPPGIGETSKPWRPPPTVEVPIIQTARPRAARIGDAVATIVTVPWEADGDGAEGTCLAADLSVGPPVDAILPKGTWIPHPNPDVSIRFAAPVTSPDLVAVASCRRVTQGVATVASEIWDGEQLVANAISTSLFMANR